MTLVFVYVAGALSAAICLFFVGLKAQTKEPLHEPALMDGVYVEVDCKECFMLNRVPAERLRDRPICGKCKKVLAPHRRLVICRVTSLPHDLSDDLSRAWASPAHLWNRVADHLSVSKKTTN